MSFLKDARRRRSPRYSLKARLTAEFTEAEEHELSPSKAWEREEKIAESRSYCNRLEGPIDLNIEPDNELVRSQEEVHAAFHRLRGEWLESTMMESNQVAILLHPAHLRIIGLGPQALPYIFESLANGDGPWFVALQAITQHEIQSSENPTDARRMREDWLQWGRQNGYHH